MLTTPEQINAFRLCALRGALKLEIHGLTRRGRSAATIIRELLGSKTRGGKQLLAELDAYMAERGIP